MKTLPIVLMLCVPSLAKADCELSQPIRECSTCTSSSYIEPKDAGAPMCNTPDAKADLPLYVEPYPSLKPWRPETQLDQAPSPSYIYDSIYTVPCSTCYIPCGFGPKGCLRSVTCCGKTIGDGTIVDDTPKPAKKRSK